MSVEPEQKLATLWQEVANLAPNLANYFRSTPRGSNVESSKARAEPVDSGSAVDVLNNEALRSRPAPSPPSLKVKQKNTELRQKRASTGNIPTTPTREAFKQRGGAPSVTNEKVASSALIPSRTSPRGQKRPRDAEDQLEAHSGSLGERGSTKVDAIENSNPINQPHASAGRDSREKPNKRHKDHQTSKDNDRSQDVRSVSNAGNDSPSRREQNPRVEVPRQSGRPLRRPNKTNKSTQPKRQPQDEAIYDYGAHAAQEERQTLPPIANSRQKGSRKAQKSSRSELVQGTTASGVGRASETTDVNNPTSKKRGRPRRPAEPPVDQEPEPESLPQEDQHGSRSDLSPDLDSGPSSKSRLDEGLTDEEEVSEDDIEPVPDPAFLGAHVAWNETLKAARKNRINEDKASSTAAASPNIKIHNLATHATKIIRGLSQTIQRATTQYNILINGNEAEEAENEINDKISEIIDEIESQIRNVGEFDVDENNEKVARSKGKKTVTDIYRRGVPDMIELLNTLMTCRSSEPPEVYDFKGIQEIVRLMDLTLDLCGTAVKWKAKPLSTGKPVVRNIRSTVFPILRGRIRKDFGKELQRLLVLDRKQKNREKTQAKVKSSLEQEQEQTKLEAERRAEEFRRIEDDIRQNQENFRARRFGLPIPVHNDQISDSESAFPGHQIQAHDNAWTQEEEHELLVQLQNRHSRVLQAEERYLKIRDAAILHNKPPEHIQRKALEMKPFLLEVLPDADYVHSIR